MIEPVRPTSAVAAPLPRHAARAEHILDAAAALILRHGFHRTTVAEIARHAGVGKGTLYLHWPTRDALFTALLVREKLAMADEFNQQLAADPAGATLRGLLKNAALGVVHRPVLKAFLLRDPHVLGTIVERERSSAATAEVLEGFLTYLHVLRDQGLARTDLPVHTQLALLSSIFLGFFLAAPLLPALCAPSDDELAELIAEAGHRTLAPLEPVAERAVGAAAAALQHYLDRSSAGAHDSLSRAAGERTAARADRQGPVRARGRSGGRSRKLQTTAQLAEARRLYADPSTSIDEICTVLGISRASLYRYLKRAQHEEAEGT